MKYIEYIIITTTEASEAVTFVLEDSGALGVAIEDFHDFELLNRDKNSWDYVEPKFLEGLSSDVKVKGYFIFDDFSYTLDKDIRNRVEGLAEFDLDIGRALFIVRQIKEEDWANSWKEHFKPFKVGDRIVVKPTWEEYEGKIDDIIIEIDPGMAFGTGDHETTSMCLQLLEKYVESQSIVFDIGCGSGILGIAAGKLGAERVKCIDLDKNACKVARENVLLNKLEDIVEVKNGNLLDNIEEKSDVIVANIIADVIISFAHRAYSLLETDGTFISSGIIKERKNDVLQELKQRDFKILEISEKGEWCAIAAKRC